MRRMARMNLIYPAPTEEPAIAGIGLPDNRHLNDLVESITMNVGDHSRNEKESGSKAVETHPKSSDVLGWSQRGHSTRRTGKPSTWERATPWEVGE
jgi:hypothetical protein